MYMNCQECNTRPATLYFTQMVNGKLLEIKICQQCAHKFNLAQHTHASFQDLLNEYFNMNPLSLNRRNQRVHQNDVSTCENCGLSWHSFRLNGKFGCANCYVYFGKYLPNLLRRVHHGNLEHIGKSPLDWQDRKQDISLVEDLKLQLKHCIIAEDFEQATILRDEIRKLQHRMDKKDGDF